MAFRTDEILEKEKKKKREEKLSPGIIHHERWEAHKQKGGEMRMEREEDRIKKAEALLKKCNALLLKAGTYAGRVNLLEAIYDQGGHCRRDEIIGMQKQIESYRGYTLTLLHRIHTNPTGALQDDICRMTTQLALYLHNELSDYHVRLKEIQKELGKAG